MTDQTCTLTYEGPARAGRVVLPTRTVRFTRGVPLEFTAAEAAELDAEYWHGDRIGVPVGGPRTGQTVGPGETGELDVDGPPEGTVTEVLAWVDGDPDRAAEALAAEHAGKARTSLINQLSELSTGATGTTTPEEA